MNYKTEPKTSYYYSLKNSPIELFVAAHSEYKTTYSTSRKDAKLFKGFGENDGQPDLSQHNIWQHVETTEYQHKLIDVSELGGEEE